MGLCPWEQVAQGGMRSGDEALRLLKAPPPREGASATTGKVSSQMALVSHDSRDQAVSRHRKWTKASLLSTLESQV